MGAVIGLNVTRLSFQTTFTNDLGVHPVTRLSRSTRSNEQLHFDAFTAYGSRCAFMNFIQARAEKFRTNFDRGNVSEKAGDRSTSASMYEYYPAF